MFNVFNDVVERLFVVDIIVYLPLFCFHFTENLASFEVPYIWFVLKF